MSVGGQEYPTVREIPNNGGTVVLQDYPAILPAFHARMFNARNSSIVRISAISEEKICTGIIGKDVFASVSHDFPFKQPRIG